jgi:hypothetical protein
MHEHQGLDQTAGFACRTPIRCNRFACSAEKIPAAPRWRTCSRVQHGASVVSDHAWIVCLWALRDYRDLAFRLTGPLLSLLAREAFSVVSKNRLALSSMLRLRNEWEIEQQLKKVVVPRCQID